MEKLLTYEDVKSKVIKFVLYKKRTEYEIKNKILQYNREYIEELVDYLKEVGYIDDIRYTNKYIKEMIKLRNFSVREITYKLLSKGIPSELIDPFLDDLYEHELKSAKNILDKKAGLMSLDDVKLYLKKKGYKTSTIRQL
jgi:Uncharacterized protein conserved in bacteria